MATLAKLKLSTETRGSNTMSAEQRMRERLLEQLEEQRELAVAEAAGEQVVKTRQVFETNENGERIAKTVLRKQRKWYWRNADGVWLLEVRYGNKALKLSGDKTAVEAGGVEKLADTIETLKAAVKAGELDKQLAAARKERMTTLRKG